MFNHKDGSACFHQTVKHAQQYLNIQRVQADCRLIKYEHGIFLGPSHLAGQFQPLGLTAGKSRGVFSKGKIAQAEVVQHFQLFVYFLPVLKQFQCVVHSHRHQCGQGKRFFGSLRLPEDFLRLPAVALSAALRTGYGNIRQKLHVKRDLSGSVADRATQGTGVVGEIAGFQFSGLRCFCPGI